MFTLLLAVGIILWPEMTLCVLLFASGHPFLGILALLTTFWSGSRAMADRLRAMVWGPKKEKKMPDLGDI